MCNVQFSILGYYPTMLVNENITVGIIFKNLDTEEIRFEIARDWQRIVKFDDDADISFMKKYLNGIKIEVENNIIDNEKKIELKKYIKSYVNQFKFGEILTCIDDNFDKIIDNTTKIYMKSNYSKEERLKSKESLKWIKNIMKSSGIVYKTNTIKGEHGENVNYDFIVNNYGFKRFLFEGKDEKQMVQIVKAWSFTAEEMLGQYQTVFVCDEEINTENYKMLKQILKKNSKDLINEKELYEFIQNNCVCQVNI